MEIKKKIVVPTGEIYTAIGEKGNVGVPYGWRLW